MQATCDHCTHWEQTSTMEASDKNKNEFGKCNELTEEHREPEYIIPVLNNGKPVTDKVDHYAFMTGAKFGCNHFAQA